MRNKITIAAALLGIALVSAALDTTALAAPARQVLGLRRLTEREYRNSIADIFGSDIVVEGVFEPRTRVGGLLAASTAILTVTPVGFEAYSQMADSVAVQVTGEKHRAKLVSCTPKSPAAPDDACASEFLSHYGFMLFRRPLTTEELKLRVGLAHKMAASSKDFYSGLRYSLATLLQAQAFLFRKEVAVPAEGKSYTLDGYSRASRLSYLLWDTAPDAELMRVAQTGELNTQAGVDRQVDRLLASPRLETGMNSFFADMLELDTFENTTKDVMIYPEWSTQIAASAREETLRSTVDLTLRQNGDLRDLMVTRKTFINRALSSIYGLPFDFKSDWVPYEFPADSGRSGVVTQISTLAMFSHPGRSSPTERGVAIMDIFLCEPTPLPPANVDFSIVNNTSGPLKTVRERLGAHATNPTCASCHNHSDPIGLTLEGFDSVGGHRLTENGQLIDVSATMQGKSFVGAAGLGQYLHDSPKFTACVARKLYAYAVGADSEAVEPASFKAAYQAFSGSGFRLRALLKGMATSPDFFNAPVPVVEASAAAATKVANNKN